VEIDYDPAQVSYDDLLRVFWDSHDPTEPVGSRQYASIIFTHNEEQQRLARASKDAEAAKRKATIHTEIRPYSTFWLAEGYHQKYYLRHDTVLMRDFEATYPDEQGFVASTAAARVNGVLGGHGLPEGLRSDVSPLGLSAEGSRRVLEAARHSPAAACGAPVLR
jgi:peptide-methionine (S)-S-oxide reductase